jgi:hypothetical protein
MLSLGYGFGGATPGQDLRCRRGTAECVPKQVELGPAFQIPHFELLRFLIRYVFVDGKQASSAKAEGYLREGLRAISGCRVKHAS